MPRIVDHEEIRQKILHAFELCNEKQPLTQISMRDVAQAAGISHQRILYYFKNKRDLVNSYIDYVRNHLLTKCMQWIDDHPVGTEETKQHYLNSFFKFLSNSQGEERFLDVTVQIYQFARYDEEIEKSVQKMNDDWRSAIKKYLGQLFGPNFNDEDTDVILLLIAGALFCGNNRILKPFTKAHILDNIFDLEEKLK